MSQQQAHMRAQIFFFLLRMALFVAIGVVLHNAQSTSVIVDCPGLWESMLVILVIKCIRMTICPIVVKLLNTGITPELKQLLLLNLVVDTIFFITECVMTSKSLDSKECVVSASATSGGHPMIAYVNGIVCVWDGSFILSHVLFLVLGL
jgi:hypothetical protein